MCVVSMIGQHYDDKFRQPNYINLFEHLTTVPKSEFEALKKEVEEMKELLKKAKIYDEKNNEPNCEMEEKMIMLRKFAEAVGINLDDILKK